MNDVGVKDMGSEMLVVFHTSHYFVVHVDHFTILQFDRKLKLISGRQSRLRNAIFKKLGLFKSNFNKRHITASFDEPEIKCYSSIF